MNFFFAIYGFHFNVFFTVRDDYSEREVLITRKVAEKFKSKNKELTK
jgi:hypothetical protein